MALETSNMGRNKKLTRTRVIEIMENATRPVWTATILAEHVGTTRTTASKRLKELEEAGDIATVSVGNATAYYLPGVQMKAADSEIDEVKRDLRRHYEDRFVGLPSAPWTAVHPNDGPAEGGDKIQIQIEGEPGNWGTFMTRLYENRRKELQHSETDEDEVQALISGELYEKPTVPIEHVDYPDDYDLEGNIGAEFKGELPKQALVAAGLKNHLIRPVNDAVFLKNVEVDWICPIGSGQEIMSADEVAVIDRDAAADVEDFDPEEAIQPTHADIVMLSDDCEPRRAYLDETDDGYRVIPADFEGNELGPDYEPTDQFKTEVREKTAVDGDLQFER